MDYLEHEEDTRQPYYKTAQICRNGHVRSVDAAYHNDGPRCAECGAENITECPACQEAIHGHYEIPGVMDLTGRYDLPKHCHNCGKPYPWTQAKLEALRELVAEMEGLSQHEKERLAGSLDDLIADTPKTEVAVMRMKKGLAKAGSEVATAAKNILVDVVTDAVKRQFGLT